MTMHAVQSWYDKHAGWLALIALCTGMFAAGYMTASVSMQHSYQREADRLTQSYAAASDAKDKLIARLAGSTVQALATATDAASTATDAAAAATSAADAARASSLKVDKAADKIDQPLRRLK